MSPYIRCDFIGYSARCGGRSVQFTLFSNNDGDLHKREPASLYCRCKSHLIETRSKSVRFLTEEEAIVHTMMEE